MTGSLNKFPGYFYSFESIICKEILNPARGNTKIVLKLIRSMLSDGKSLHGLEKKWLQELKDDTGESLQAQIIFKSNLVGTMNKIFCNITAAANQIVDGFSPCRVLSHTLNLNILSPNNPTLRIIRLMLDNVILYVSKVTSANALPTTVFHPLCTVYRHAGATASHYRIQ